MSQEFGVNLWWTCPEFVMPRAEAEAALRANGFEPDQDLPKLTRRKVVSRAAYSFQDRRHKHGRKVTEKAKENGNCVVYGILCQTRKGDEEVAYDQDTTIRLDKADGRVEANGALANDFFKAVERYEDALTDDDVRDFLRNVVRMCFGVAKRPSGGIYFVPERCAGIIESAQRAVEKLGIGARLYVERLMNGPQERTIVWEAVESDIDSQIQDVLGAVERIEKRANSVKTHEAKLGELGQLMNIYRDLLGQEAKHEELAERLEEASQEVAKKLAKLQQEEKGREQEQVKNIAGTAYKRSKIKVDVMPSVEAVLEEAAAPLHYREIAKAVEAKGVELRATKTKTKAQWLLVQVNKALRENKTGIRAVGRGMYTV